MTHRFDFLFWKGWAKRDLIFYSFRDFKYYGWRSMEEFEKESGRVSEAFTTMIPHGNRKKRSYTHYDSRKTG